MLLTIPINHYAKRLRPIHERIPDIEQFDLPIVNEIFDEEKDNQVNETVPQDTNNIVDKPNDEGATNNVISDLEDIDETESNTIVT